jgi:hypothetical protein
MMGAANVGATLKAIVAKTMAEVRTIVKVDAIKIVE